MTNKILITQHKYRINDLISIHFYFQYNLFKTKYVRVFVRQEVIVINNIILLTKHFMKLITVLILFPRI